MLTFAVGLLILGFAVALLGMMLDEVYNWGVFYYGVHV